MIQEKQNKQNQNIQENLEKAFALKKKNTNLFFFYSIPLFIVIYIVFIFILLVIPTVNRYFEIKDYFQTLDDNLNIAKQNVANLNNFYAKRNDIVKYDEYIKAYIPEEGRLGIVINKLIQKASDFSLETEVKTNDQSENDNLDQSNSYDSNDPNANSNASDNYDNKNKFYFNEINSGEGKFSIDLISDKSEVYVLNVFLNVKGPKSKFLGFLESLQDFDPKLTIVSIDYKVVEQLEDPIIEALIRFESYILRSDPEYKVRKINLLSKDDPTILTRMQIEEFDISKDIYKLDVKNKIQDDKYNKDNENNQDNNQNNNEIPLPSDTLPLTPTPTPVEEEYSF